MWRQIFGVGPYLFLATDRCCISGSQQALRPSREEMLLSSRCSSLRRTWLVSLGGWWTKPEVRLTPGRGASSITVSCCSPAVLHSGALTLDCALAIYGKILIIVFGFWAFFLTHSVTFRGLCHAYQPYSTSLLM